MEGKHTPTPWRVSDLDNAIVLAADHSAASDYPYCVTICEPCVPLNGDSDYGQFNAAFIVRACNVHDDLIAALKAALTSLEIDAGCEDGEFMSSVKGIDLRTGKQHIFDAEAAYAAIAKAEGK